jgi:hypothetical protein
MLAMQGLQYRLGDFTVGIARAVQKPLEEFRGIILEVAYHPLHSAQAAEPVLQVGLRMLPTSVAWVGVLGV